MFFPNKENKPNLNLEICQKNSKYDSVSLLLVCSADRGLCGGFNGSIIKFVKKLAEELKISEGNTTKFIFVGKKAYQALKRLYSESTLEKISDFANPNDKI